MQSNTNLLIFFLKTLQRHVSALRNHLQAEDKRVKMASKSRNMSL